MGINIRGNKVLEPVRFVDAFFDFTPMQRDFTMLVQDKTSKQKNIKSNFSIDLKPYFEAKGIELKDVRNGHFKEITSGLLESKVTFKYNKGDKLYSHYNLFSKCSVKKDFTLEVSIIDDVLPLFYINKLKEGHFKDNALVRDLFESSHPEYDSYVTYLPETFVEFEESSTKKLFTKLLQYRRLKKYRYCFGKDELYLLLGYGKFVDDKGKDYQTNIFNLPYQIFKQTKYKGADGWKNLRKLINKGLKKIDDHKDSGIKIKKSKGSYLTTEGKPIRNIYIDVEYDHDMIEMNDEQKEVFKILKGYNLSEKQSLKIISDYKSEDIKARLRDYIVRKSDHYGKSYYGEYKRADHRKIDNIAGFIYGIVFRYGSN